jgi:hypothetical protein
MFEEIKSLKDASNTPNLALKDNSFSVSYTKTNKLISALYMVTDIMDEGEPLRNKLRTLGVEIISDMYLLVIQSPQKVESISLNLEKRIKTRIIEILSFLEVSFTISLISEMNYNILRKEFIELEGSIEEYENSRVEKQVILSEFFVEDSKGHEQLPSYSKGHSPTRIGVQKGSTLMQALSDIKPGRYDSHKLTSNSFDALKKERRYQIITLIKNNPNGVTITDIKTKAAGVLATLGEKTLQRELISMVKENVLYKTGSKRWSRYFLPK